MKQLYAALLFTAVLMLVLAGCDSASTSFPRSDHPPTVSHTANSATFTNARADFPVFHQGFNHDVEPWVGQETPGPFGWCGTVERIDRRATADPSPSAGRGYATIEHGACNDFFTDTVYGSLPGKLTSAPGSLNPDLLSTTWPRF